MAPLTNRLPINIAFALVLGAASCVFVSGPEAKAALSLVTNRSVLNGTDFIDWSEFGIPGSSVSNPSIATSNLGDLMYVVQDLPGNFLRSNQGDGWNGNFAPGDALLVAEQPLYGINSLTLADVDCGGISAGGLQIQSSVSGLYTARVEAFDVLSQRLGFFDVDGMSSNAADNSAIFLGVTSNIPISRLSFSLRFDDPAGERSSFSVNRFDFTSVPGPLPVLGAGAAFGFSRKLRARLKASRPI